MSMTQAQIDAQLGALGRERASYDARGLADRVAQVDEEIARVSAIEPAPDPVSETPAARSEEHTSELQSLMRS